MSAAFGFGTSSRFYDSKMKDVKQIPGPGEYAPLIVTKKRMPSWGMGTQKRVEPGTENKIVLGIPGPTAYNVPSKLQEGPKVSLSPRLEVDQVGKFKKEVPGPGSYTPSFQRRANFSFSFGLKPEIDPFIKHVKAIPGPGQYEINQMKSFSRIGASLDKNQQENLNKTQMIVPGPGAYQPLNNSLISRNSAPKYGFGSSERRASTSYDSSKKDKAPKDPIPGPGQYEIKGVIGNDGPKKSLSYKYQVDLSMKEQVLKPGPGQYMPDVKPVIKTAPNFRIGTSTREHFYLKDKYKHQLPPPNIYEPKFDRTRRNAPAAGFGYGDREFLNKTFNSPGPGNYQSPTKVGEGPKYIMGVKLNDSITEKRVKAQPSPDNYNPKFDFIHKRLGNYSVGKAKRQSLERKNNVPGPGEYYQQDLVTSFGQSPQYGFGSSSQRPQFKPKVEIPGPGTYKLKSTFADVPNYLIPNQNEDYKFV